MNKLRLFDKIKLMKVVIVGLDDEFVASLTEELAKLLQIKFIDFNDLFCSNIVFMKNKQIDTMIDDLQKEEKRLLNSCVVADDFIMSVPNSTFISNLNYKIFKNVLTICVEIKNNNKIKENIQKLLKKYCKFTINKENINLNEIKNIILNYK